MAGAGSSAGEGRGRPRFSGLADVEAAERVSLDARLAARAVYPLLKAARDLHENRISLHEICASDAQKSAHKLTYGELFERVTRAANAFAEIGRGAPTAILLDNRADTHVALWGAAAAGGAAPVNPLLKPETIAEILHAGGARALVTDAPGTPLHAKAVAAAEAVGGGIELIPLGAGGDGFEARLAAHRGDRLEAEAEPGPDATAALFHTGGTTGAPKIARQTQLNQAAMSWMLGFALDLGARDVVLTGLPLFHANAAILTGLAPLTAGATLVLAGRDGFRDPRIMRNFWRIVEAYGVTIFSGVPTIYSRLLEIDREGADVASLRYGVVGAAPMPVSVFEAFEQATGVRILELYGMTESTCVSTCNPRDGERRIGSIGVRLPYHEIKVAALDAAGRPVRDAGVDEPGVLCLRGPTVIPGYVQAERNAELFLPGGWLNTGDLARIDADGYAWLTGRAKDLIIRGGHNIDPGMIEAALHRCPAVALCAAVGEPDADAGEVPVAYVTLQPGAQATEAELAAFARDAVDERPAAPRAVRILDAMPVTAVGKIFKPALREDAAVRAARAALAEAGIEGARVEARTDARRGLVVTVSGVANAKERAADGALQRFAFVVERPDAGRS